MGTVHLAMRMLFMITDVEDARKIEDILFKADLPVYCQWRGQGTAKAEWLDVCGLSGRSRLMTMTCLPGSRVGELFARLEHDFKITQRGKGIAGTIKLTGMQSPLLKMLQIDAGDAPQTTDTTRSERTMDNKTAFTMILTAVKEGYSDEVVEAANSAGARGGSVIRGRRRGSEALAEFMGISTQEEQEFVMIIARRDQKADIMNAIKERCGLNTEAQGFVFSIPLEDVIGMS